MTGSEAAPPRNSRWKRRLITLALLAIAAFLYSLHFHPEREDWPGQRAKLAHRQVQPDPMRIDKAQVLGDVQALASPAMAGRKVGTPGGKAAREYILARFRQLDLEPAFGRSYQQAFVFKPFRGLMFWRKSFWGPHPPITGVNVAGIVRGTVDPTHFLLVTAHYDHLGIRDGKLYPGADDNASGVATMLALARWYSVHPPRHSILFVGFDGEERGLKGSEAFEENPPVAPQQMLVDVNYDMVSRNVDHEIFATGTYQNPQLAPLIEPVRAHAKPTILFGHDSPEALWNWGEDWVQQSDQCAFADHDVPFVYFGVADHPDYHQPGDTFGHIDPPFFLGVVESQIDIVTALDAAEAEAFRRKRG